ncbi:MAG: hypothetical protein AAF206_04325 [Bacteroidota bacterium]
MRIPAADTRICLLGHSQSLLEALKSLIPVHYSAMVFTLPDGNLMNEIPVDILNQSDILLLDHGSLHGDSSRQLRELCTAFPQLPVMVLDTYTEMPFVQNIFKQGVRGYLHADTSAEELDRAFQIMLTGERYLSPGLV